MKLFKKFLCLMLSLIIIGSCCGMAFATESTEEEDTYDHIPQIYVCGIGSRAVYKADDPTKTSLFYPINTDLFIENLGNFGDYAKESIKNLDPHILYNCIYSWLWDTFGLCALDTDGVTNLYDVAIDPCDLDYEGNGEYDFNYDSRLDPVDLAHQLHDYVALVKEHSGSDKIEFVASSYGASIMVAYMNEYPEELDSIDSVLLCVPSLPGVDFVGEVFSGTFDVNPDALEAFLEVMVSGEDFDLIMNILNKSGILDLFIFSSLEPLLKVALMDAVTAIVHDVFGTFPSMWSFVQDKDFYDALERVYGEDYADPDHSHAKLIEKITYYHEEVMVKAPEIIENATERGIHFNIITKYGRPSIPLSESGNMLSDGLVDLEDASFGATCSEHNGVLGEDYKQKLLPEQNFLSVDGCVDASTCLLPYNTWFIKGLEHGEKTDAYYKLLDHIVYNDLDINSDPAFPQFLMVNEYSELVPLEEDEPKLKTNIFQDIFRLMRNLFDKLIQKIKDMFDFGKKNTEETV